MTMNRVCQKGVLLLFTDNNGRADIKTVCSDGLLFWTPISIALAVFRSELPITNVLRGSRRFRLGYLD
jgi:hypothetical protein